MSFGLFHYKDRNHDGVDDELVGRPDGKYGDIGVLCLLTFEKVFKLEGALCVELFLRKHIWESRCNSELNLIKFWYLFIPLPTPSRSVLHKQIC